MQDSATAIKRFFSGEERTFELRQPSAMFASLGSYEDSRHGNLEELVRRARDGTLGASRVQHILIHGLGGSHPLRLIEARELVTREMQGRPYAEFLALAVDIIAAAYAGASAE